MQIYLNNQERDIAAGTSVAELVASENLDRPGVAVAVNNRVVPRNRWHEHKLEADDRVVIIKAVCGG